MVPLFHLSNASGQLFPARPGAVFFGFEGVSVRGSRSPVADLYEVFPFSVKNPH